MDLFAILSNVKEYFILYKPTTFISNDADPYKHIVFKYE